MKRPISTPDRKAMIATAGAVLSLGLVMTPAAWTVAAAAEPGQTAAQEQDPIDAFVTWAKDKAADLDTQFDAAVAEAAAAGADASNEAKEQWQEARAAIEAQRKELAQQVEDLQSATKSEWKDAKAATRQALDDLGRQIDDFKKNVGGDGNAQAK